MTAKMRDSTPGSFSQGANYIGVTIQDIDTTNNIAHVVDQLGKAFQIYITRSLGKQYSYPKIGEDWIATRQFGDWVLAVNINAELSKADSANFATESHHSELSDHSLLADNSTLASHATSADTATVATHALDGLPVGGLTNNVLVKNSNTNFDTSWLTSTSSSTASSVMLRDSNSRAQVADPSAALDIVNKQYVDARFQFWTTSTATNITGITTTQVVDTVLGNLTCNITTAGWYRVRYYTWAQVSAAPTIGYVFIRDGGATNPTISSPAIAAGAAALPNALGPGTNSLTVEQDVNFTVGTHILCVTAYVAAGSGTFAMLSLGGNTIRQLSVNRIG